MKAGRRLTQIACTMEIVEDIGIMKGKGSRLAGKL